MLDRQKVEVILTRRFRNAPLGDIAAAVNAIMALDALSGRGQHAEGVDEEAAVGPRLSALNPRKATAAAWGSLEGAPEGDHDRRRQ